MTQHDGWALPDGLPATFDGEGGFDRLCDFLQIANRQHKQALFSGIKVHYPHLYSGISRKLTASQRWQELLTRFYNSAAARRRHWRKSTNGPDLTLLNDWPCLEDRALRSLDPDFQNIEIERAALHEAIVEFTGLVSSIDEVPEWQRPALALWPAIRSKVLNWNALDEDSRKDVTLAVFAVATILDDVRILRWSAGSVGALASEFAFAVVGEHTTGGGIQSTPEQTPDELIRAWRDSCHAAARLASILENNPERSGTYEEFRSHVKALEDLREPVLSIIDRRSSEKQIQLVIDTISDLATEFHALWLQRATEPISSQWKQTYLTVNRVDAEKLLRDGERARKESRSAIAKWRSANEQKQRLKKELARIDVSIQDDFDVLFNQSDRETEVLQTLAEVNDRMRRAMRSTLNAAVPEGQDFDPTRHTTVETGPGTTDDAQVASSSAESSSPEDTSGPIVVTGVEDDAKPTADLGNGDVESGNLPAASDQVEKASGESPSIASTPIPKEPSTEPTETEDRNEETCSHEASKGRDKEIEVLWKAIPERPGIAFHIARLLTEDGSDHPALPPADLVAAAVLANHTQSGNESTAKALKELLARIEPAELSRVHSKIQDSLNLLLFCATACPTLFAPVTGASSLLRATKLGAELSTVYELAKAVADHADRLGHSVRLDTKIITAVLNQANWSQDFESTRSRARDWLSKARKQRIIYRPAHRVWIQWLRQSECLGRLATLVARADPTQREEIDSLRKKLRGKHAFDELVQSTDRKIRGRNRGKIGGKSLPQLRKHAQPLLELAADWLRFVDARSHSGGFVEQSIVSLHQSVQRLGDLAVEAIDNVAGATGCLQLRVSLALARQTVSSLRELFQDQIGPSTQYLANSDAILSRDLLFVHSLTLDSQFVPTVEPLDMLAMLGDVSGHSNTIAAAFETRLRRGDLVGAGLACRDMESSGYPGASRFRGSLEQTLRQRRIKLIKVCNAHREALEQSLFFGQLDEKTAESSRSELVSVESALESGDGPADAFSINRAQARIDEFGRFIRECRRKGQSKARERFEELLGTCDPEARARIESAISGGDLMTANELMSRVESGQPLDQHDHEAASDPFRDFMAAVDGIDEFTADPGRSPASRINAALKGDVIPGVGSRAMSNVEVEEAKQLLEAWYELSVAKRFERQGLDTLLQALGLPPRQLTETERGTDYSVVTIETDLIEDRLRCPLPQFGSEACGRYRVLLNWTKIARESISRHIDNRRHDAAIVFHFGSLGKDRNWLRNWAVTQHRLFVVIDESLALFLAGHPSGRLSALFRCVLPFSDAEPYVTTSGLVPPELFFGRARERRGIMDPNGPCFIYGGRQLGKTALLRSVEREFHQPERLQFAKWIDLKVREIGHARRSAEIWPLLWRELRDLGVLRRSQREPNPHNPRQVDMLIQSIEKWVRDGPRRRLLLLLDEADEFLATDALDDFRESTRLKGMMDRTDRRVKVVLAGLHNVLRITERANHPLAHLGEPINIGPLLTNGEWIEAQKLVRDPLQSVGFHFEPQDLSTRILAQTNYYPSLIQLYGAELVRHLRNSGRNVPYGISDEDIAAAYRSTALRDAIRQRFQLTLQLDPRYEVIAYALASELLDEDRTLGHGLERRDLAEYAREWWPDGFGIDDREFNVLLQEMEGLGVLRSIAGTSRYTLRNPNVLLLLGSKAEIYQVLGKQREVPKRFEPSSFHARFSDTDTSRCPLTYEQESMLRKGGAVAVIAGCKAARTEDLKRFLSKRIEKASFREFSSVLSVPEFKQKLGRLRPQSPNPATVVLVSHPELWNADWLVAAQDQLRGMKGRNRIKVLFVANPETLWTLMKDLKSRHIESPEWIAIEPWDEIFLRHWLRDNNQPHDKKRVQELMEISGGWPKVLEMFVHQRRKLKTWDGRINALHAGLERTDKWLTYLGLNSAVRQELDVLLRHEPILSDSNEEIDLLAELENINADVLRQRVRWSQHLGLVTDTDGLWEFNPLVVRLLRGGIKE